MRRAVVGMAFVVLLSACGSDPPPAGQGAPVETAAPSASPTSSVTESPATDQGISGTFEANGRQLFIDCIGRGSPTFVLEAGEGGSSDAMIGLKQALAERGTACSYDRANLGRSSSAPTPRTAKEIVADLNALLSAAAAPGPHVLIGHSAGGMFVQLYGRTYAEEVAGVVSMNPVPPFDLWQEQAFPLMSQQERNGETAYFDGQNGESFDYRTSSQQLAEAPAPPDVPFEMLLSTIAQCDSPDDICGRTYPAYEEIMREVSDEWPGGGFSQVEAGHEIFGGDLEAVLAVVDRVLDRIQGS